MGHKVPSKSGLSSIENMDILDTTTLDLTTEERELAQRLGSLRALKPSPQYQRMGRARLLMQIAELEATAPAPATPSPVSPSPLPASLSSRAGWFRFPRFARYAAAALLLFVILFGSGYAMIRKSMPGEHLYAMKIGVERAQIALTPPEQQPVLFIRFTQRRLEELEQVIKSHPNEEELVAATQAYRQSIAESAEKVDEQNTAMAANMLQQQTHIIDRLVEQTPLESQEVVKQAQVSNEQAQARVIERSQEAEAIAVVPIANEIDVSSDLPTPSPTSKSVLLGEEYPATSTPTHTSNRHSSDWVRATPVPTRMMVGVGAEEPVRSTTRRVSETPTSSPEPTASAIPSPPPQQTSSPTQKPSATSTLIPTRSPTLTPVPTNSPTLTPVPTRNPTSTPIPTIPPTLASTETKTPIISQTTSGGIVKTRTPTATMTITPTATITPTMTSTPVPTIILTPTLEPAAIRTPELFATSTATVTPETKILPSETPISEPTLLPLVSPTPDSVSPLQQTQTTIPLTATIPAIPTAHTPMPFVNPTAGHAQDSENIVPVGSDETQEALPLPIQLQEPETPPDAQEDQEPQPVQDSEDSGVGGES